MTRDSETLFYVGDSITSTFTFTNTETGDNVDPTTVTLKALDPLGNETTYSSGDSEWANPSVGVYKLTITVSTAGWWTFAAVGTGSYSASIENSAFVNPTSFA